MTTQGYLTAGLTQRIAELTAALDLLAEVPTSLRSRAVTGALVRLETAAGDERAFLILPGGDGATIDGVCVVSPHAPVARAMFGAEEGDEVELPVGVSEIVSVS
ncbi:MAG: GreA/GreB family elongation factor [Proteobacteria bacterium]|nr:GreA/GreB family elongation factor [Pseudomonadota bacterium]